MTWGLLLALSLSQAEARPVEPLPTQDEPPPEARVTPPAPRPQGVSVVTRAVLAGGGGTLAGGASLGIGLLLANANPGLDPLFSTAALASLLVSGVAFSIHAALGGRGEVTLSFILAAAVMVGAGALTAAITQERYLGPLLVAAIGSLPAAALATFALEGTSPRPKRVPGLTVAFAPNGFFAAF